MRVLLLCLLLAATVVAAEPEEAATGAALALLRAERYDEAIEAYRRLVRDYPRSARAHYELAAALGFLRRYPEAVAPIEQAIRLAPEFLPAYRAAAIIHANNRDPARVFEANLAAAELGDITAMFELVWMCRDGRGVDPSDRKALAWAERAALGGHVAAMDLLVDAHLNGDLGATVDVGRARHWALAAWRARHGTAAAGTP